VLVDDAEVFNAGALAFAGVVPSNRRVREVVLEYLRGTGRTPPKSPKRDV
jgi:hypothetical protein